MSGSITAGGPRTAVRVDLSVRAARQLRALLARHPAEPRYGVRLALDETLAGAAVYRLSLSPAARPDDLVLARNGFEVFVAADQGDRLDGVRIDFVESAGTAGFTIDPPPPPPQRFPRPGGQDGGVPGPPALVRQVQEAVDLVRPALQRDGGDLALVAVEQGVAHVALTGACSSCSSAVVTLTGLVERALTEAVPQIHRVALVA